MKQNSSGLIGKEEDIKALESKKGARILVYSDSHGNAGIVEQILLNYGKACDMLVFCGDGICDLAQILSKAEYEKKLSQATNPRVIELLLKSLNEQKEAMEEFLKNENVRNYIKQGLESEKAIDFLVENAKIK